MDDPTHTIAGGFARSFNDLRLAARRHAEGLTDAQFWARPYPYGNSMGHLTLHITGNLHYYIGTRIAGTGYVRDREREFADPSPPSKEEALRRLDEAVEMVVATLGRQTAADWGAPYSATGADNVPDRFAMFLRCATHFHHHVGQMIYLAKEHHLQAQRDL